MSEVAGNDWSTFSFGALCSRIVNGGTPDTGNSSYWNGETPWITGADFTSNGIGEFRRFVSNTGVRNSATSVVKQGNLLVVTRTGVGKLAVAPCDIAISQDITGVYIDATKAETNFIYYLLSRELEELKKLNQGTSINGIVRSDLEMHAVRVPAAKSVQKKIAAILTAIDNAIEKTEALIAKYQQIKVGLMHDLFTRGVLPNGQLRPPRSQAPELYQETEIGWIPKEWRVYRLDVVADVLDPNPSHRNPIYHPEGFPFISTVEFIDNDEVEVDTSRRVVAGIVEEQELRCKFTERSIGFSRKGTIAEIRFLPTQVRFALLDSLCVINPKIVDASFLFYSLRSESLVRQSKNMTMGQALPQVSIGRVRELIIPVPTSIEQAVIGQRVNTVMDNIKSESAHLRKLHAQKHGLMQDLLTGKVPVQVDEPDREVTA